MSTSSIHQSTAEQRAKFTRILVIGRINAGKTTILRRLCNTTGEPVIFSPNGKKIESSALNPSLMRGDNDIENQMIFESYPNFIFHDSRGFEAGDARELKLVQEFIARRSRTRDVNEQLHAIWYCIPTTDDRPITAVEKKFFNGCGTGLVPVIVLWTKTEFLDLAKIKQLVKEGISKSEAMQQAPQKAWADYEKIVHQRFDEFKYPPKAYIVLRKMHEPGADCKHLIQITTAVLSSEELQRLYGVRSAVDSVDLKDNKGDRALFSAQNILVTGGNFVAVENGGFHMHVHMTPDSRTDTCLSGWEKLRKMVAFDALRNSQEGHSNSQERNNPPKCHPATRKAVRKKIMEWVEDLEKIYRFIWLHGPAGAGKSAIAQTITELCYEMNILAASFFFSSTAAGRSDSTRLIATIVYQLCLSIPEVKCYIEAAIERDPDILRLPLEPQVQKLIIRPLSQAHFQPTSPRLIVIDGLDECNNSENMQHCILSALSGVFKSHGFPICFLITSRPEQHIRESFQTEPLSSMTLTLDNSYFPDNDIQVFLRSKFDEIKREHPLNSHIPLSWPSKMDIKRLVQQSSGQFIYASAVIKYVESPQHRPTERLGNIFDITGRGSDTPFAELDALYNYIFSNVDDIRTVLEVLGTLLLSKEYWFPRTVNLKLIDSLLDLKGDALHHKLINLHSIIDIPAPDDDKTEIRILHASLGEFLQDQTRSGQYYIDGGRAHAKLTQRFLTFIPSVREEYHSMDELQRLSCQFFMVHCALSYPSPELLAALRNFNISGFLSLLSSTYPLGLLSVTINRQISNLFAWLKRQRRIPLGRDLYTSSLLAWDKHTVNSLVEAIPLPGVRLAGLFVASALHPEFWKHYTVIREIVNWKEPQDETLHLPKSCFQFLCAGELDEEELDSIGYHKMLSRFLDDPSRSGPFYADEDKFTCLTTKTVQFITDSEVETFQFTFTDYVLPYDDLRIWASECLPFFLSKASRTEILARLLETDLLPLIKRFKYYSQKKKSKVIDAIHSYIDCVSEHMTEDFAEN